MAARTSVHMKDRTLNEVLHDLDYTTEPAPGPRDGVKMILAKGRVEVFRGRSNEVWVWLRRCPTCDFRGYTETDCTCRGTGVRPYFQQAEPTGSITLRVTRISYDELLRMLPPSHPKLTLAELTELAREDMEGAA